VIDPPLFEWSKEENRLVSSHHPFTAPKETDYPLLDTSPESVGARAYELILNGTEIASGSIRIHNSQLQQKVFKILGLNPSQIKERFGFFIEALNYGAPPHGGIAFGLDRLIALMLNTNSIRDVIAFPKTQSGVCLTSDAPYYVEEEQLKELGICIIKKNDQ
jgi:aspartyl-tRNA synthetase